MRVSSVDSSREGERHSADVRGRTEEFLQPGTRLRGSVDKQLTRRSERASREQQDQ